MKHLLLAAFIGCTLASCEQIALSETAESGTINESRTKAFTFHVKGDFITNYVEMSRAGVRLDENNVAGVTDLWVLDYVNTGTADAPQWKLMQQVHQSSTNTGFGSVPMSLTYGHHDIKFIASKGETPVLTANTGSVSSTAAPHSLIWGKVKDTFTLDYPVDVTASSNGNRAPELTRAIGGVKVVMVDAVPANAATVDVTWQRSASLALPSLVVASAESCTQSLSFPSAYKGQSGKDFTVYGLVGDADVTTDVTMLFKDADGVVISSVTVPNVEVKRNRMTVLKGECFNRSGGFHVVVDSDWLDDETKEF